MHALQQDGAVAPIKIKLRHGDTLIIDTLVGTVQVNALRRFLAEGFQIHLQQNPLLHQILNFEPREERAERLTPLEKKLYRLAPFMLVFQIKKMTGRSVCWRRTFIGVLLHMCASKSSSVCASVITTSRSPCMWPPACGDPIDEFAMIC